MNNTQTTIETAPACQKSGHTPGPWTISGTFHSIGIAPDDGKSDGIASVFGVGQRAEADARLIAAAPDLLAAVIYAEAMAEMEIDELRKTWDEDSMPVQSAIIARDKYRAALAKGGAK